MPIRAKNVAQLDPKLYESIMTGTQEEKINGLENVRKLLSTEKNPPIQAVINANGLLARIIEMLYNNNEKIQFEASWILTNLVSGTSAQTRVVVDAGVLPPLINHIKSSNESLQEQAVWAIGNIAGDSTALRDKVLEAEALPLILEIIKKDSIPESLLKYSVWSLSNICRHKPALKLEVIKPALPVIDDLLKKLTKDECLFDICWMLNYLTNDSDENIQAVLDTIDLQPVFKLIDTPKCLASALAIMGNIATGTDEQTEKLVQLGLVGYLVKLIDHPKRTIKKEVLWMFSNLTAGTQQHIQAVIDSGIIPRVISLYPNSNTTEKRDIAYIIGNVTENGSKEQNAYLIEHGGVELLLKHSELETSPERARIAIDSLKNLQKLVDSGLDDHLIQKLNSINLAEKVESAQAQQPGSSEDSGSKDSDSDNS